ncbi:centriole, cilia and spindle-associated protein isoform X2 [Pseudoliparis swirei]|uniref:centriole, cilia and spindle-associated protein isoform X2 n=1 Tax=Pseudoliparis swirei TaxID=2059687 RepID=UPI0024BE458F|nr:centriole, cilia and spindle-associated protein isoform X2 [Pseudoliparis swirei]
MVTRKIRSEYMKKFRDPKLETFSQSYEDSLKYRLTRRLLEHSHQPWFWEGWEGSESSGRSTPRPAGNRIAPLALPPPPPAEEGEEKREAPGAGSRPPGEDGRAELRGGDAAVDAVTDPGVSPSEDPETDAGPVFSTSSDGEPAVPAPKRRPRRRAARPEAGRRVVSHDDAPAGAVVAVRKTPRAKSQPPISTKENRRPASRTGAEARRTQNPTTLPPPVVQTPRDSPKRGSVVERRRARSADLQQTSRLADDRWVTEYMRCFSAQLR